MPGLHSFTGVIEIPGWQPPLAVAWLFLLPVGVLTIFIAARYFAGRQHIPLDRRRRLFFNVLRNGTYAVIGVHAVFTIGVLPTRLFDPLTELWFGQRFTSFLLPYYLWVTLAPLFGAMPFIWKAQAKLFGSPQPGEAVVTPPLPTREAQPHKKGGPEVSRRLSFVTGFGVISFVVFAIIHPDSSWGEIFRLALGVFAFCLTIGSIVMAGRLSPQYVVNPEELATLQFRLQERADVFADQMGLGRVKTRVMTDVPLGKLHAQLDMKGIVGVGVHAIEHLSAAQLDFVIAHELAHKKLRHLAIRLSIIGVLLIPILFISVCLMFGKSFAVTTSGFIFSPFLIVLVAYVPVLLGISAMRRKMEFAADKLAVETTGNPAAAVEALIFVTTNSAIPGIHQVDTTTHPEIAKRIAAIQMLAAR
jgi:hypothetical protein